MLRSVLLALVAAIPLTAAEPSALWGADGAAWCAEGPLGDFSRAGFRQGDAAIPDLPVATDVRAHGARGDGVADDTEAFRRALGAATAGAVLVPAGTYLISAPLELARSGLVLRGEGPGRTILRFPRTLTDHQAKPVENAGGRPTSAYSWSGGFLAVGAGKEVATALTAISAPTARGDRALTVADPAALAVGDELAVTAEDDQQRSLTAHLYAGDPGVTSKLKPARIRQLVRVVAVTGTRVQLDRPLRTALQPAWKPALVRITPTVSGSGIEDLALAFPGAAYQGHFTELGWNGIELRSGVRDCWVRRVAIHDCDSGVFLMGDRCTVSELVIEATRTPAKARSGGAACTGHHAISLYGADNLVERFALKACFIHDVSVEGFRCAGNVVRSGSGTDLALDHHKKAPHANLFSDLDCGAGGRVWFNGGGTDLGRPCGAWTVFWNLRAARALAPPPAGWAPAAIALVGLPTAAGPSTGARWLEPAPDGCLPRDLYAAQLAQRDRGR